MEQKSINVQQIIYSKKIDLKPIGDGIKEGIFEGTIKGAKKGFISGAKAGIEEFMSGDPGSDAVEDISTIVSDIGKQAVETGTQESVKLLFKRSLKEHVQQVTKKVLKKMPKMPHELAEETEDYIMDAVGRSYQQAIKKINDKLPKNLVYREIVDQLTSIINECIAEETETQKERLKGTEDSRNNAEELRVIKKNSLKKDVKDTMENMSETIVTNLTYKIAKAIVKRALKKLREELCSKSYQRLKNRLEKIAESDKELSRKLDKSTKQMLEEISCDRAGVADFTEAIEQNLLQSASQSIKPLASVFTLFQIGITTTIVVAVSTSTIIGIPMARDILDKAPPQTNLSHVLHADRTVTFIASATDNVRIKLVELYVNGELVKTSTDPNSSYTGGPYPEGETISYRAVANDGGGNKDESTGSVHIPDFTLPEIDVSGSLQDGGRVKFTVHGEDNVGLERIELYVNGELFDVSSDSDYTIIGGPYPEGQTISYLAVAFDTEGNKDTSEEKSIHIPDRTPPEFTETAYLILPDRTVTFSANGEDNVGVKRIELYINGELIKTSTDPYSSTEGPFREGETINYSFTIFDLSDNFRESTVNELFIPYEAEIGILAASGPSIAAFDKAKMTIYTSSNGGFEWETSTLPASVGINGIDIEDMAVSEGGLVTYVVTGTETMYVSSDQGESWKDTTVIENPEDETTMLYGLFIAVTPDDPKYAAVAGNDYYGDATVYITEDSGATWNTLGAVDAGSGFTLMGIAISVKSGGNPFVAVAGYDGGDAEVWYYEIGALGAQWTEITDGTYSGWADSEEIAGAVAFSPNFNSDAIMLVVTQDDAMAGEDNNQAYLEVFSFNVEDWNDSIGGFSGYPVSLDTEDVDGTSGLVAADIAPSPDYLGSDDDLRQVFVGIAHADTGANGGDGIFFCDDDVAEALKAWELIHSVDFDGTKLVAGSHDSTTVFCSENPLEGEDADVHSSSSTKSPGGEGETVVSFYGDIVAAGTAGNESAFAVSKDKGRSFNDVSLIDTQLSNITDLAIDSDGSTIFLLTNDGDDTSLWRRTSGWERVLNLQGKTFLLNMVRLAPGRADIVYVASTTTDHMLYSGDSGESSWHWRSLRFFPPVDLAVESHGVVYILLSDGTVAKSINTGFTWPSPPQTTGLKYGGSIISVGINQIVAGGTNGDIAWSSDGNDSWIITTAISGGGVMRVSASGVSTQDFIYAGSSAAEGYITRWEIDTKTSASIIPDSMMGSVRYLVMVDGRLFALLEDPIDGRSRVYRLTSPSEASANSIWDLIFR